MRLPNALSELLRGIDGRDLCPLGLINTNAVQDRRELVTILRAVDLLRVSSKNVHASLLETQRDVLGQLTYTKLSVCTYYSITLTYLRR